MNIIEFTNDIYGKVFLHLPVNLIERNNVPPIVKRSAGRPKGSKNKKSKKPINHPHHEVELPAFH